MIIGFENNLAVLPVKFSKFSQVNHFCRISSSRDRVWSPNKESVRTFFSIFEPTYANAQGALMHRFPSVRLSVCHYTKSH